MKTGKDIYIMLLNNEQTMEWQEIKRQRRKKVEEKLQRRDPAEWKMDGNQQNTGERKKEKSKHWCRLDTL